MNKQQPEALRLANVCSNLTRYSMDAHLIAAELLTQQARITELESQLAQRFDAADVATASAQGFRDGVARAVARNTLRRAGKNEIEDELEATAQPAQQGVAYAELPEPLSKRPSEANTLVWVADPISSTGVRGVFVDDITCLWWWGAGLIFQKEADAAALALRMRSAIASHEQASSQVGEYPALVCDYCGALTPDPWHSSGMLHGKMSKHIHSCDACAARGATHGIKGGQHGTE